MRYFIQGTHPESDSEWLEFETNSFEELEEVFFSLGEIDGGLGFYTAYDVEENKEVEFRPTK